MIELIVVNSGIASALIKAGVVLLEHARIINGHKAFVFQYSPGQGALVRSILLNKGAK